MTPTERVEKDVDKFINEIYRISSAHRLYLQLAKQQEEDAEILEPAHQFFSRTFEAIESEIIVSLTKLYEGRRPDGRNSRSDRNLMKLVDFVRSNRTAVEWGNQEISHEQVEEHERLILEQENIVENIIGLRDEFYAHHGKDYFLDSEGLTDDYPLDVEEIQSLLQVAEGIVEDYYHALTGRGICLVDKMDVEHVFHALGEVYKNEDYSLASDD